jgi:hypothetical protein
LTGSILLGSGLASAFFGAASATAGTAAIAAAALTATLAGAVGAGTARGSGFATAAGFAAFGALPPALDGAFGPDPPLIFWFFIMSSVLRSGAYCFWSGRALFIADWATEPNSFIWFCMEANCERTNSAWICIASCTSFARTRRWARSKAAAIFCSA